MAWPLPCESIKNIFNNEQECPDTDDVVEEAVKNTLGETARCIDYALLEYGGAGRHCDENFH